MIRDELTSSHYEVKYNVLKWAPISEFHLFPSEYIFTSLKAYHTGKRKKKKKNQELRNPYTNQGNSNVVTDQSYWMMGAVHFSWLFILMGSVRTSSSTGGECTRLTVEQEMRPKSGLAGLPWGLTTGQYLWLREGYKVSHLVRETILFKH